MLLCEAHNLAVAAADAALADEILHDAQQDFLVDRLSTGESAWKTAPTALEEFRSAAQTPADFSAVAENGIALAARAAAAGQLEIARQMAVTALSAARKAEDRELVNKATLSWVALQSSEIGDVPPPP